ncbi:ketoacyl-ACP synthase III [bacterium SCSIO 12741]|nr:ketoacyl-ACP synthase III [bacterium SCSIO 12741]
MPLNSVIIGSGSFIPERVVENAHFEQHQFHTDQGVQIPGSSTDIIRKFEAITGIKERRYVTSNYITSDISTAAAMRAIEDSGMDKEEIDVIIVAHNFGDLMDGSSQTDILPSLASRVKGKLGIQNPSCIPYDLIFGCPGWLQGMIQADIFIQSGYARTCLVVGAETLSRVVDPSDRDTMIFADGAGATLVTGKQENTKRGVLSHAAVSHTGPEVDYLYLGAPNLTNQGEDTRFIKMQGRKIYEYALNKVPGAMDKCIRKAGLEVTDLSKILIHQANEKMDEAIVKRLYRKNGLKDFPPEILPMTIEKLGNSSVATIPTLYNMITHNQLPGHSVQSDDHLLFASVGAGMNINAMLYRV